ncbi:LPXTG cell wall anchor domain-containing protein [Asanoa sp. WMMD1127]|uniref:LPXTG cell wall anchor domain-containing protein n=1 Tax=Asanoa sp. WMMD1127 TaxID=3016107 RepID=UPI002415A005|nr:LPXTG cell wall anchor domain-containing protein [Asanoa sp. WMMD1127]MDG4823262.1 LPXTG cell wall anchor domain-containing protein [Asanoa sp. WMMD1127]
MVTARRLFAGLAVAGAFVAATAPAAHAAPNLRVEAMGTLVAPDSSSPAYMFVGSDEGLTGTVTVTVDSSALDGAYVSVENSGWRCDTTTGALIHCELPAGEDSYGEILDYQVHGKGDAKPGDEGSITFTVEAGGAKAFGKTVVTVAEPSDLAVAETVTVPGLPGGVAHANQPLANIGQSTVEGTVLLLQPEYRTLYDGNFENCTSYAEYFAVCTFDEPLAPGTNYRLSEDLPFRVDKAARTGAVFHSFAVWLTEAEWALIEDAWITDDVDPKPGTGDPLRLEKVANSQRVPQVDVDGYNNFSSIDIKVGGDNRADLAAVGATAAGAAGATVAVQPSVKNLGPAALELLANEHIDPVIRITIPEGTTAVEASGDCAPYGAGDEWLDWEKLGTPGAKEYGCLAYELNPGDTWQYFFTLKIDKVVPDATGAITVKVDGDPNAANDTAAIVVNGTDAGGGTGGGDGGLPVTGPQATLIASLGALLVGGGVAGFVLFRRRRMRFIA